MSRTKTDFGRRLALFAGSSSFAAGLCATTLIGTAFLPAIASAQACSPATVAGSGPGADTVQCLAGTFPVGIAYTSEGNLTVSVVANGATVNSTVTANGVDLTGTGADSVTWNSTIGSLTGGTTTNGPVIDVLTNTGAIAINTAGVTASNATISHAIRAVSTGGGAVSVTTGGLSATNSAASLVGLEARSAGGDVTLSSTEVNAVRRGILAQTSGSGDLTITTRGAVSVSGSTGVAAIDAITGAGLLEINLQRTGNTATLRGGSGIAVRTNAGGNAQINILQGVSVEAGSTNPLQTNWIMDLTAAAGTTTTIANSGNIQSGSGQSGYDDRAIKASGAGRLVIDNAGLVAGLLNFSALTGGATFTTTSGGGFGWHTVGVSTLSPGNDAVVTSSAGTIYTGFFSNSSFSTFAPAGGFATGILFGGGNDSFGNAGRLALGEGFGCSTSSGCTLRETVTTFTDLEAFNNSGSIMFGFTKSLNDEGHVTDFQPNDRLVMLGATFNGLAGSRLFMDVDFAHATGQTACVGSAQSELLFYAAADCLDLRGGSTTGETLVTLNGSIPMGGATIIEGNRPSSFLVPVRRGGYIPAGIVIVDVSGAGSSAASHFVLDPGQYRYSAANGGVLDEGLFVYALAYDETAKQHRVISLVGGVSQFGPMAQVAQGIWRSSAGSWFQRQSELRDVQDVSGMEPGFWGRALFSTAERDIVRSKSKLGRTFTFDDSYETNEYGMTGGLDVVVADRADLSYVAGLMAGYAHTDLEFVAGANRTTFDGVTGGVYGGLNTERFFVDATVNLTQLDMSNYMPALKIGPADIVFSPTRIIPAVDTNSSDLAHSVLSVGARVETGWRISLADGLFVEPLAGVDYVRTSFEDIVAPASMDAAANPPVLIVFDDVTSLRGSIGARLGLQSVLGPVNVRYSLIGKLGNEFEGDVRYLVDNAATDLWLGDDTGGEFGEIGAAVNVFDATGLASGFLNVGGEFADDYQSINASLGGRFRF